MRRVSLELVDDLVRGALVYGSGGGGGPHLGSRMLHAAIERHGPVPLVDAADLDPDALVLPVVSAGTPYVLMEKLHGAHESARLRGLVEAQAGQECAAVLPIQLGAVNGTTPVAVAAHLGLPCLDADVMRRCFPSLDMTLLRLAGLPVSPITIVGSNGVVGQFTAGDAATLSALLRSLLPGVGLVGLVSAYQATAGDCARLASRGALSDCIRIGAALRAAYAGPVPDLADFLRVIGGTILFTGVAVELVQHSDGGWPRGVLSLSASSDPDRYLRVDFQNENLVASEGGTVLVSVPDIIGLLDVDTGTVVETVDVALGQELHVIASPVDERWHTAAGLALVAPRVFGYDIDPVRAPVGPR